MTRILTLAAFALALAGGWLWWSQGATTPGVTLGSLNAQEAAPADTEVDTSSVEEMSLGAEDAPLTIVEYASYTCPHCRAFHEEVMPELKAEYIDTGKVRLVYREVYFDPFGLWASLLARCGGGDERFFAVTDLLYENQADWLGNGDRAAVAENLRTLGLTAGLSNEQIDACMGDEAKARALVAAYQENATADAIDSTPSFVIDGTKYGNMPWAEMKAILDEELAG